MPQIKINRTTFHKHMQQNMHKRKFLLQIKNKSNRPSILFISKGLIGDAIILTHTSFAFISTGGRSTTLLLKIQKFINMDVSKLL